MDDAPIHVLLVEDNPADARLLQETLRETSSVDFPVVHVGRLDAAARKLKGAAFDVMLLDLSLPDSLGLDTVGRAQAMAPRLPIVVLTGADDEELALEAVRLGAQDYLIKGQVDGRLLRRAVRYAMERKRSEEQLKALNETLEQRVAERTAVAEQRALQLRKLTAELAQTEQRERKRLAQILHDNLQQLLVAAKFNIALLDGQADAEESCRRARKVDDLLDDAIRVSCSLSQELSPPIFEDATLAAALDWLAEWMEERYGLATHVDAEPDAEPEDEDLRMLLFQATRELLFNVVKHAKVGAAHVRLARADQGLQPLVQITVSDAGAGFHLDDPGRGLGLFSLRERLGHFGGQLDIRSLPGRGTHAMITIPKGASSTR